MVDTQDLKSCGHYGCAGSSPAPGTEKRVRARVRASELELELSIFFPHSRSYTHTDLLLHHLTSCHTPGGSPVQV